MSSMVPCQNPAHGVKFHIVGSAAAAECAGNGAARAAGVPLTMSSSVGTSAQPDNGGVTIEDWKDRLRRASSIGDQADDYERGDPMQVGLLAIKNGSDYDEAARRAAQAAHPHGTPWSGGDAPAWAYAGSKVTPKGTYQGDENLTIKEFDVTGSLRSNFMVSTGRVGEDVYIEQPDMQGVFDAIAMANAQSNTGPTSLGNLTDPTGARRLSTKLERGYDEAVNKELDKATPEDRAAAAGDPEASSELKAAISIVNGAVWATVMDDNTLKQQLNVLSDALARGEKGPGAAAEVEALTNEARSRGFIPVPEGAGSAPEGPPAILGYDPSKIEGSRGNRTYWRDDPVGTSSGPGTYQHVSGGVIEARGYTTVMAWNQYGKNLGEFKTTEDAQRAVETDATSGSNWASWRYFDVLSRSGRVSGMGAYSTGDDFTV